MNRNEKSNDKQLLGYPLYKPKQWLRAAVSGANDGIIPISSLAIGAAAASSIRDPIILATVAGLVAGALSMAAGELSERNALGTHMREE